MGYPDWQTENTLAQLIAGALASAGIPVLGNPIPLYDLVTTAGGGPGVKVGAYVYEGVWQSGLTHAQAMTAFDTYVNGNPCTVASKSYLKEGQLPTTVGAFDQALIDAGADIYLSVKPSRTLSADQKTKLAATLAAYQAAGAHLHPILWQECQLAFSDAATWLAYWAYYQPTIKAAGLNCVYDAASSTGEAKVASYWPTPAPDEALQDLYWSTYSNGVTLGTLFGLGAQYNVPVGVGEWNVDASNNKTPTLTQWNTFINYLIKTFQDQMTAGFPVAPIMFFMGPASLTYTNNQLLSSSAFQVPGFNSIVAALSVPPTAPGFTVPSGNTHTMLPLAPSPVAGYALADGQSYDMVLSLTAGAGSTLPFATLGIDWVDEDLRNTPALHQQRWEVPAGVSTSAGTQITGKGPQRAKYLKVNLTNKDSVTMTGQLQLNSTARTTLRDDLRWEAPVSVNVPGYTLPGGGAYTLELGEVDNVTINAGNSKSWLFSMFAGRAYLRVVIHNAAGVRTVNVTAQPQPTSVMGTANLLSQWLPTSGNQGDNDVAWELPLPRCPVLVSVNNQDANQITCAVEMVAQEP